VDRLGIIEERRLFDVGVIRLPIAGQRAHRLVAQVRRRIQWVFVVGVDLPQPPEILQLHAEGRDEDDVPCLILRAGLHQSYDDAAREVTSEGVEKC
jgi:hypothetical protein